MSNQTKTTILNTTCGLLVINKPAGMTSRDVVNRVQRVTRLKKCGHAGTLDPLATGVLVICLGRATRLVPYVQEMTKHYRAEFRFGLRSSTDDIEGDLEQVTDAVCPAGEQLALALGGIQGEIEQIPPRYSAIKVGGRRAYALARQGVPLELQPRRVRIDAIHLQRYTPPDWEAVIACGSGTYIRSIGRDIGERFGCGCVMTRLTREAIGQFSLETAIDLDQLEPESWQRQMVPPVQAVDKLPRQTCTPQEARQLFQGQSIPARGMLDLPAEEEVAVLDEQGRLVAVTRLTQTGLLKPHLVLGTEFAGTE